MSETQLVQVGEFGVFDAVSDVAHGYYIDGDSQRAIDAARQWRSLAAAAGDRTTWRYLLYTEAIAQLVLGDPGQSIDVCRRLLGDLEHDETVWRAKALAMLSEACTRAGLHGEAMTAIAEAEWLASQVTPGIYGYLSANMAVALALESIALFEHADARLLSIARLGDPHHRLLLVHESTQLAATWAAWLMRVGRPALARERLVLTAERALLLEELASALGETAMAARARVFGAWASVGLGEVGLGVARVRACAAVFEHRPELLETHLTRLVLAAGASADGSDAEARKHLETAIEALREVGREMWLSVAMEQLAQVEVAAHGPHPAVDLWSQMARAALEQVWSEREGRFAALQDRDAVRRLTAAADRMGRDAEEDPLTGLGNRRLLAAAIGRMTATPVCALFLDIDTFKQINDDYNHDTGDQVLRRIATVLRESSRAGDVIVRNGGDEFLVLNHADQAAAASVAERLRLTIAGQPWDEVADGLRVSVSIGLGHGLTPEGAIAAADRGLALAKRGGRNRVGTGSFDDA